MHNKFAVWFSRVVWLGIVCNLFGDGSPTNA
jgi:hypothetical protein